MSVNRVILVGRLGADPESRTFPNGGSICNLRIATSESWKDKNTGERQERTEWHRVQLFGKIGEVAQKYLNKGSQVYLEGRIQTRKWQNQQGEDQYTTEIIADQLRMLGSKSDASAPTNSSSQQQQPQPNQPSSSNNGPDYNGGDDYYDDDIPF